MNEPIEVTDLVAKEEDVEVEFVCPVRGLVKQKIKKVVYKPVIPKKSLWAEEDLAMLKEVTQRSE